MAVTVRQDSIARRVRGHTAQARAVGVPTQCRGPTRCMDTVWHRGLDRVLAVALVAAGSDGDVVGGVVGGAVVVRGGNRLNLQREQPDTEGGKEKCHEEMEQARWVWAR